MHIFVNSRGTKYLPIGVEDHFLINVDIYNNGEEAHQAKVKITHSKELSFVNVRSDIVSGLFSSPCENQFPPLLKLVKRSENMKGFL